MGREAPWTNTREIFTNLGEDINPPDFFWQTYNAGPMFTMHARAPRRRHSFTMRHEHFFLLRIATVASSSAPPVSVGQETTPLVCFFAYEQTWDQSF